jgi:F-type H+-transporting ATPase subunit epsilon
MAKRDTFHCSVVTPERQVLDCEAASVVFPAHDGETGVLVDRAPLVCRLGIGEARIVGGSETTRLFIDGGFAQVVNNRLTLLTQQAKRPSELDRTKAKEALDAAHNMPMLTDAEFESRQQAIRRAEVHLHLAGS